jgi:hypothetical protein
MTSTNRTEPRDRDYRSDQVREHYWPTRTTWTWCEDGGHRRSADLATVRGFPLELRTAGTGCIVRDLTHARELVQGFALGLRIVAPNGAPIYDRAWIAQSRYLGADAALAAASWLILSDQQARSILDDIDPLVLDDLGEPNLSGEWADDLTPELLAEEVGLTRDEVTFCPDGADVVAELATVWEQGRDLVWWDAVQATALRTLGDIPRALEVESRNERKLDELRKAAGL